jgi:hypothetical protein
MWRWHTEWDPGRLDLALGADQALGHGRLGNEEGASDLLGAQPTQRTQCERDLRIEVECGVAAREDELEPLVWNCRLVQFILSGFLHVEQARLHGERLIATDAVDCPVAPGCDQPGPRVGGRPVAGPPLGGDRERFLGGFLGEVEVAEEADQGGEDAAPLVAEDLLEDC